MSSALCDLDPGIHREERIEASPSSPLPPASGVACTAYPVKFNRALWKGLKEDVKAGDPPLGMCK